MTRHATPEQWAEMEQWAGGYSTSACLIELRDRISALETHLETEKACIREIYDKLDRLKVQHESNWSRIVKLEEAHQQPEPIDEEENERRFRACLAAIDNTTPEQVKAAVAKASAKLDPQAPAPAGGLVERVGPTDAAIEEAAKLIHASMRFAVPDNHYTCDWVERGNSLMQDEARRTARAVLARWGRPALTPVPVSERFEFSVAQAVMEAYWDTPNEPITTQVHQAAVAAALRAAADQVAPETPLAKPDDPVMLKGIWDERRTIRAELLAIAAELEGSDG